MERKQRNKKLKKTGTTISVEPAVIPRKQIIPLYIYTGDMAFINVNGELMQRYVPTFMHKEFGEKLSPKVFKAFEPGDNVEGSDRPVLVYMPKEKVNFIAAMTTLERIHACYPTCQIDIICKDEYKYLLPSYAKIRVVTLHKARFYRTFTLTEAKLGKCYLVDALLTQQPRHLQILKSSGLFMIDSDKDLPAPVMDKPTPKSGEYLIVAHDDQFGKELRNYFNLPNIHFRTHTEESNISSYRGAIILGDSSIIYEALYFKLSAMAFIKSDMYKRENQMKVYPGLSVWNYPDKEKFQSAIDEIEKFVGVSKQPVIEEPVNEYPEPDFTRSYSEDTAE